MITGNCGVADVPAPRIGFPPVGGAICLGSAVAPLPLATPALLGRQGWGGACLSGLISLVSCLSDPRESPVSDSWSEDEGSMRECSSLGLWSLSAAADATEAEATAAAAAAGSCPEVRDGLSIFPRLVGAASFSSSSLPLAMDVGGSSSSTGAWSLSAAADATVAEATAAAAAAGSCPGVRWGGAAVCSALSLSLTSDVGEYSIWS